ncbi:MAG: hypothetical protein M1817_003062 [Caeruleum heppii]|nr:MAG: hypothetical protein M1817_003062 [Caeruleum heppii]
MFKKWLADHGPKSWVMLSESEVFVPLPGERKMYTSPPRTSLSLKTPNSYPGKEPMSIESSAGCVHLTNQRIIYLPVSPTPAFESFSAPILNLHDTHVSAPFFGPNVWTAVLQPVPAGGIPPVHSVLELKMVFKEGGAFDFHSQFERIKERLQQAVEAARAGGDGSAAGHGPGALSGVNLAAVHLEQLPAYEEANTNSTLLMPATSSHAQGVEDERSHDGPATNASPVVPNHQTDGVSSLGEPHPPPNEPPPGYEEAQLASVATAFEQRDRKV